MRSPPRITTRYYHHACRPPARTYRFYRYHYLPRLPLHTLPPHYPTTHYCHGRYLLRTTYPDRTPGRFCYVTAFRLRIPTYRLPSSYLPCPTHGYLLPHRARTCGSFSFDCCSTGSRFVYAPLPVLLFTTLPVLTFGWDGSLALPLIGWLLVLLPLCNAFAVPYTIVISYTPHSDPKYPLP